MNEPTPEQIPTPPSNNSVTNNTERSLAMVCHLGSLAGFLVPLANILVPLLIWLFKKDEYPFVDDQGKESLNFQISMLIYFVVASLTLFILVGFVLLPLLAVFDIVSIILASVESYQGKKFRYKLCIRFIK